MARQLRLTLCGAALVATVLLAKPLLPVGLGPTILEIALGAAVYAAMLNMVLWPGHLTRIIVLVRGSIPALSS
jgi:hypothetical protein